MKFLGAMLILFILNCLFCWLLTADIGFGPVLYLVSFFGGIFLISIAGVATLKLFYNQQ